LLKVMFDPQGMILVSVVTSAWIRRPSRSKASLSSWKLSMSPLRQVWMMPVSPAAPFITRLSTGWQLGSVMAPTDAQRV
jgi:hypothetical protein